MDDKALWQRDHLLDQVQQECEGLKAAFPYLAQCHYVGGNGPETPVDAFVVLDMPQAVDVANRRAFSGPVGLITKQLMALGGLEPARCWLTYAIKYRLPRGRRAKLTEMKAFRKPLQEEWNAIGRPKLIVTVGLAAFGTVTGTMPDELPYTQMLRYGQISIATMRHPRVGFNLGARVQEQLEAEWEILKDWRNNGTG